MERKAAGDLCFAGPLASVLTITCLLLPSESSHSSNPTLAFPPWWLKAWQDRTVHLPHRLPPGLAMGRVCRFAEIQYCGPRPFRAGDCPELSRGD